MAEAGTLNCLMCGAPARTDATKCEHCGARLKTVACPSCFGMIFQGAKFCSHCGARADRAEKAPDKMPCPHCRTNLTRVQMGPVEIAECAKCDGIWLENGSFNDLCADREKQAAVLGRAVAASKPLVSEKIKYVKCPVCLELMHRTNFSNCSGVVIDVCKAHGTWFDADELQRIIAFIREGGVDRARERQKREFEEARRKLEAERNRKGGGGLGGGVPDGYDGHYGTIVESGELAWTLGTVVSSLLTD